MLTGCICSTVPLTDRSRNSVASLRSLLTCASVTLGIRSAAAPVCAALTIGLQYILSSTRFGSRLRASVDDQRVAAGLGINVNVVFLATFAFGSGLAGLGGALGAEVLGLDPNFPLKFMFYFLIVCAVGGTSSITGPLLAALGSYRWPGNLAELAMVLRTALVLREAADARVGQAFRGGSPTAVTEPGAVHDEPPGCGA